MRWTTLFFVLVMTCAACDTTAPTEESSPDDTGETPDGNEEVDEGLAAELPIDERSFQIGVAGVVPRNWPDPADADWNDLFAKVPGYGELWGLHVSWNEARTDAGVPEQVEVIYGASEGSGVTPYVALGFEPDTMTQAEADAYFDTHGEAFQEVAVAVAETYTPDILLLGVEVNRYWEKSSEGFDDFLDVYAATYDAVKEARPGTKVATNVQWEYMKGAATRSGQEHTPHLDLIDRFGSRLDLVTITTYPWLDVDHPSEIPDDYFSALVEQAGLPLMITETGWPSEDFPDASVTATERAQVDYLIRLLELTADVEMEALVWAFPHDINTGVADGIFDHVSLRTNAGPAKEAYAYWEALRDL